MSSNPRQLPAEFLEKMQPHFSEKEFLEFQNACLRPLRKSIRVNTLKISVIEFQKKAQQKKWKLMPIPWCPEGFWIDRPEAEQKNIPLGKTGEHALGLFYIQEASSMLPPVALLQSKARPGDDSPQEKSHPGSKVLDMAAAPGSKTTQLAAIMQNAGLIVANEFSASRIKKLFANVERCGVKNVALTHFDGEKFGTALVDSFDAVLLDAPCTGEGTVRKDPEALQNWSERNIHIASGVQKKLILSAFSAVKPGGFLVYSTCTLNREENEEVCFFLQEKFPEQVEFISLSQLFPGAEKAVTPEGFLRIWPHLFDTEGFFVAKIRKKSPENEEEKEDFRRQLKGRARSVFGGRELQKQKNTFPFSPVSAQTFQKIEKYYDAHFGFVFPFSREQLWERGREIWLFPEGLVDLIGRLRFDRIGIKFCELHEKGITTEHETASVLGSQFSHQVRALSAEEAADFLLGKNVSAQSGEEGEILCTMQGVPLGLGRVQGDVLKNLLPRTLVQEKVIF